jgi:eukaryotic-like serine/threonine-protein kinase
MGEVYKARDTRLDRFVAVKVLPADKGADPDRVRRFFQEAKAASALNHPSIVTIYDVGSEHGTDYLAMELVVGKTLEQLIPRDGFRLSEILRIGVQMADALAKAHAAGIVHRDLKPGNVMITGDGLVKILDFGLAKVVAPPAEGVDSRTVGPSSGAGLILGTASFMSPEQAEGLAIDGRSDIFSFGAMLYEMATGQRAFGGDTAMSTISAILRDEPKRVSDVRRDIPSELERVIKRCLRKDPARRFQTMADLKVALEELKEESDSGTLVGVPRPIAASASTSLRTPLVLLGIGLLVASAVGAALVTRKPAPAATIATKRPVPLTTYPGDEENPSFSPDGSQVVFSWNGDKQDNYDIYVKVVGPGAPLRLTTDPGLEFSPKWSPDGRSIAFMRATGTENLLMLIPALGGSERTLAHFGRTRPTTTLAWSNDGKWIVAGGRIKDGSTPLHAISLESGEDRILTSSPSPVTIDIEPVFSPNGRSIAFARWTAMNLSQVYVLDVSSALEPQGQPRRLPAVGEFVRTPAWTADGKEILFASGIDLRSNIYRTAADGSGPSRLIEALGDGVDTPTISYSSGRLAYTRSGRNSNIWRLDLQHPTVAPAAIISSTSREAAPAYSPDGTRVVFYSNRSGLNQIWVCDADGTRPAQLTSMDGNITGSPHWSPDGKQISFDSNEGGQWQIYVMSADGGKPKALTSGEGGGFIGTWSRDGQWIYYGHGSNGAEQVWKVPSQGGAAVQVTKTGGSSAWESDDGKTLYIVRTIVGNDSSLWRMPVGGGELVPVLPLLHRYDFVVRKNGVYYAKPTQSGGTATIEHLEFSTGKVSTLYTLTKPVDLGFALSPDGRYLLFAQNDFSGSDLMLVEGFK